MLANSPLTPTKEGAACLPGYIAVKYGPGHGKRCNVEREVGHISVAVGASGEGVRMECSEAWNKPSKYNANRELGPVLAAQMPAECGPGDRQRTRWQALGLGDSSLEASPCLALFLCSIPFQDPDNDAGLHCSIYNADVNAGDYTAPSEDVVKRLVKMFPQGLPIVLVPRLKVLTGSRVNDPQSGGIYYVACNVADAFKEQGPRCCRHPKQQSGSCGLPLPTRAVYDALRYGA